jgi:hypothetical protein
MIVSWSDIVRLFSALDRRLGMANDTAPGGTSSTGEGRGNGKAFWYLLLIIPFIATLWVPFYAGKDPELSGIPFFYWYQFLWIIISSLLTGFVYFVTR